MIEKRITWALELLSLTQYRKTSPFLLSGGERKRVALASVLAWDPATLILDEPTIGQDHEQKEKLRQFILQMQTQKKTVVIVTHDVEFVAECNPRVVLMKEGKIVADGMGNEILTDPHCLSSHRLFCLKSLRSSQSCRRWVCQKTSLTFTKQRNNPQSKGEQTHEMSVFDGLRFRKVYLSNPQLRPKNKIRLRHRHLCQWPLFSTKLSLCLCSLFLQMPFVLLARVQRQWLRSLRGAAFLPLFIFIVNVGTTYFTQATL